MGAFSGFLWEPLQIAGWTLGALMAAFGLIQLYRERCRQRRGHNRLEPSDLITAGVAVVLIGALLIGGGGFWQWRVSANVTTAPAALLASPVGQPASTTSIKLYPQRARDDLANAMADLSGILNRDGQQIVDAYAPIQRSWNEIALNISADKYGDLSRLENQLKTHFDTTEALIKAMEGNDGFRKKYSFYADEIENVVHWRPLARNTHGVSFLQKGIGELTTAASTLKSLIAKDVSPGVLQEVGKSYGAHFTAYQIGMHHFETWLNETRERVQKLNLELRGG